LNPVNKQTKKKRVIHNPYLSLCDGSAIHLNMVILRSILRIRFLLANEIDLFLGTFVSLFVALFVLV